MADFQSTYKLLFKDGEVCEIRALGLSGKGPWKGFARGTVFGYFDNPTDFARAAESLDRTDAHGVYVTLNPVRRDFLGRSANALKAADQRTKTTADPAIQCVRWLPLDFDPIRPEGGSDLNSNEAEFRAAWELRNAVHERFQAAGIVGVPAISGNGAHLLVRLDDLPPTEETAATIRDILTGVARWSTDACKIDTAVFNPARIWKLYGTVARKSDHTEERPQRRSAIQFDRAAGPPRLADVAVAHIDACRAVAAMAMAENPPPEEPDPEPAASRPSARNNVRPLADNLGAMDVGRYLRHYGREYRVKDRGDRTVYVLPQCLFNPEHRGQDAGIVQQADGKLHYQCFHDSCRDKRWSDARQIISGGDSLAKFHAGYDPGFKPARRPPEPPPHPGPGRGRGPAAAAAPRQEDDWLPAYCKRRKGGGAALKHAAAADHFEAMLGPIRAVGEDRQMFRWNPDLGYWQSMSLQHVSRIVREDMGAWAKPAWISNVVDLLQTQTYMDEADFQPDPGWINVTNCMIDPLTLETRPHAPEFNSRIQLPVAFDHDADHEPWVNALHEIFVDDPAKIDVLQEFMGYCLYPRILWPGVIWAIGSGGNGKGVVEHVMCELMGQENVAHIPLKRFGERFGLIQLRNKLLNTCGETSAAMMDLSEFKQASAGDEVQAESKNGPDVKFRPVAKHYISMNELPATREQSNAMKRRLLILEFNRTFTPGKDDDPHLRYTLAEKHLSGVFTWALVGLQRIMAQGGFSRPQSVQDAMDTATAKWNTAVRFVRECCVVDPESWSKAEHLHRAYMQWAADSGVKRPFGRNTFYAQLAENGLGAAGRLPGNNERAWIGVGLMRGKEGGCEC